MTDTSDNPSDNQSLRYAINNAASNDQIQFNLPANSVITLNSANGPLAINRNLTITGPGASNLKIDGGHTSTNTGTEVFSISSGETVSISSLTIADGYSGYSFGGGIDNAGSLTVSDCTLSGNTASSGGGIYNLGSLSVSASTLSGNTAEWGGGINNSGSMTVSGSILSGNSATAQAGGIHNSGSMSVSGSTLSGNSAPYGDGGGILNIASTSVTVSDCTLSGNSANDGGGIWDGGSTTKGSGSLTIMDCTLFGNSAKQGGGISFELILGAFPAPITLTNDTLLDNSASTAGGGIWIYSLDVLLHNTLIAGNEAAGVSSDVVGSLDSASDYNLIGDGSGGLSTANHNLLGTSSNLLNSLLAPLANYGGPTQTMALLPGSPAIDAGSSAYGGSTDQRGKPRVGPADIGAFESQGFTIAVSSGNNQNAVVNTPFANPLVVTVTANNAGEPVAGGLVTFTMSSSGASAVLSGSPASIDRNGNTSVTATANGTTGSYSVTANAAGIASPASFNLTNTTGGSGSLVVTTLADENTPNDGKTSLREAIAYAETLTGPQTISFDPSILTSPSNNVIDLLSALPELTGNITIDGPGAGVLNVHGNSSASFSVFTVSAGATAAIDGLTISGGSASYGGGIDNAGNLTLSDCTMYGNSATDGGGIYNKGTLSVTGSTLFGDYRTRAGNSATYGGGIYNSGGLVVSDSTLSANSAASGGGIYNKGSLSVSDSTLSGNTASDYAGIYNYGSLTVSDSTLSGNWASTSSTSGGIYNEFTGNTVLRNSIIAGNYGGDVVGADVDIAHSWNNLIGTGGNGGLSNGVQGNQVGVSNPGLAPLGNYGGSTQTMALLPGSPAINAGSSTYALPTDQRGLPRFGAPDIGAFESQGFTIAVNSGNNQNATIETAFANPLVVSVTANNSVEPVMGGLVTFFPPGSGASAGLRGNPAPIGSDGKASVTAIANLIVGTYTVTASASGVATPANFNLANTVGNSPPPGLVVTTLSDENTPNDGETSLHEAIAYAETLSGPQTITFDPSILTKPTGNIIDLTSALPDLTGNITIQGPGANVLTVQRDGSAAAFSVFAVDAGATAAISGLTISGGSATNGGGIDNKGSLSLNDSILTGNSAGNSGGGIYSSGALQLQGVTVKSNQAIGYNGNGTSRTRYGVPVGVTGGSSYGGGLYVAGGSVSLTNDTLSGNHAQGGNGGGGFIAYLGGAGGSGFGGGLYVRLGTVTLTNDSLSGNIAQGGTGGAGGINFNYVGSGGVGGNGSGGGLFVAGGSIIVTNNTLSGNTAQGGIGGHGGNGVLRSYNAPGGPAGGGGKAFGGGVYAAAGSVTLTNDTLSNNKAQGGQGGQGGQGSQGGSGGNGGNGSGGGLFLLSGSTTTLHNALIAEDSVVAGGGGAGGWGTRSNGVSGASGSASAPDVSGNVASSDHDLIGDGSGSNLSNGANGDLVGTFAHPIYPLLAPLGNYGGPTQTMALLPGSPAIDAGDSAYGGSTDQRGKPRVGATDIGAFESQGFTIAVSSGNNQHTLVNTAFTDPLVVTVTAINPVEPVMGGLVTFSAPGSGAGATLVPSSPASITVNDTASVNATANGTPGSYSVIANTTGALSPVTFSLLNQAIPTLTVTDLGGIYNGNPFPASATAVGVDGKTPVSGSFTFTYYSGPNPTGTPLTGPPINAGRYTVVATFTSSDPDYTNDTAQTTFTIAKATTALNNLTVQQIILGTNTTTLSGKLTSNSILPVGQSVSITLKGITQTVRIGQDGAFSARFAVGALNVGMYVIQYNYAGDANFSSTSGTGSLSVAYGSQLLFNNREPVPSGHPLPIKLELTDARGSDVSAPYIAVTATSLIGPNGNPVPIKSVNPRIQGGLFQCIELPPPPPSGGGRSNPPLPPPPQFAYVFKLDTKGFAAGTYTLYFTAGKDPTLHSLTFVVD